MSKPDRGTPPGAISDIIRTLRQEEQNRLAIRENRIGMAKATIGSSPQYLYLLDFARDISGSPYHRTK